MKEDRNFTPTRQQYGTVLNSSVPDEKEDNKEQFLMHAPTKIQIPATFEQAIVATGFGRFNYILLLLALPSTLACMFVTTNMSFVIPAAQCDLGLTLMHMGLLNASPFVGMILSAFFWGYLADTSGRRQILIYGFIADSICNIICAFSFDVWMLATMKFLSGFIVTGPFAVLMSYLSEFHSVTYRSRIIIITGIYSGTINLILPLLAWFVMRMGDFSFFNLEIHSWQIFILLCSIPSMISGLCYTMMPETPKFLMTIGKYEEALNLLKKMYSINTNKDANTFPITELISGSVNIPTNKPVETSSLESIKKGWKQMKPLFYKPHLWSILLILPMQFCTLLGSNTLRLWLPQLFTAMDEFEQNFGYNNTASICDMMNYSVHKSTKSFDSFTTEDTCVIVESNAQVYLNSAIVGICSIIMNSFVAVIINKVNKSVFLAIVYLISGCCGIALIWASNSFLMLSLSSLYAGLTGVAVVTMLSAVVELFPTSLRTMTVSLTMMTGRIGTIIGNFMFPMLLASGCIPPFLLIGGILLVCIFPLILLPAPKDEEEFK